MISACSGRPTGVPSSPGATVAVVSFIRDGVELVRWPLVVTGRPADLTDLDHLARLQLAARQLGASIEVDVRCPTLRALVGWAGLADALQVVGEAEGAEEIGVEEVVKPDDPVA